MTPVTLDRMSRDALRTLEAELSTRHDELCGSGLKLDLTRGKPSPEQLALADPLDRVVGEDYVLADGTDVRNYGGLDGIPEARRLGAALLGVREDEVLAGGKRQPDLDVRVSARRVAERAAGIGHRLAA